MKRKIYFFNQSGFTLIEVLVAFLIFMLSAGILYELYATTQKRSLASYRTGLAMEIAENVLAEQKILPSPWAQKRSGQLEKYFYWEVDIRPFIIDKNMPNDWNVFEISVHVNSYPDRKISVTINSIEWKISK